MSTYRLWRALLRSQAWPSPLSLPAQQPPVSVAFVCHAVTIPSFNMQPQQPVLTSMWNRRRRSWLARHTRPRWGATTSIQAVRSCLPAHSCSCIFNWQFTNSPFSKCLTHKVQINIFSYTAPEQFCGYICHEMLIFKNIDESCLQHGSFPTVCIALSLRRTPKLSALLDLTFKDQIVKYAQALIVLLVYAL